MHPVKHLQVLLRLCVLRRKQQQVLLRLCVLRRKQQQFPLGLCNLVQAQQSAHCLLPSTLHLQLQGTACAACHVVVFVPVEKRLPHRDGHRLLSTSPVRPVAVSVSVGS